MKKLLVVCLALIMVLGSMSVAFADVTTAGSTGTTPVLVNAAPANFSVTVPTGLPIEVSADGVLTTSNAAKIINNSKAPIKITEIQLNAVDPWTLVAFNTDFLNAKVGEKNFGFEIFNAAVPTTGMCDVSGVASVPGGAELSVPYDANVNPQKEAIVGVTIANAVITVGWDEEVETPLEPGLYQNGVMVASWDELVDEGTITLSDNTITAVDTVISGDLVFSETITGIGSAAFLSCKNLTSVKMTNNVVSFGEQAFSGCTGLKSIVLSSSIKSIGIYAFANCTSLETIEIPDGVTLIDYNAFQNCTSLAKVSIGNGVEKIGDYAFSSCTSVERIGLVGSGANIEIPNNVTTLGQRIFSNCTNLTDVVLPNSITSLGAAAFIDCNKITNVNLPSSVGIIESSTFENCTNITTIDLPIGITSIKEKAFKNTGITKLRLPDGLLTISQYAFSDCKNLQNAELPASLTSVGMYTFRGCINLKDVYYLGTEEQWGSFYHYNYDYGLSLTLHYESTMPE